MFLRERTNKMAEVEAQHCLLNRLYGIPVIGAGVDRVSAFYEHSKKDHPYIDSTLTWTGSVVANRAAPVLHRFDRPIMSVEQSMCHYLGVLEEKYPAIKKTPDEIWTASSDYYEQTAVKTKVDGIIHLKDEGIAKVHNAKEYCTDTVNSIVSGAKVQASNVVSTSKAPVDTLIRAVDWLVNRYVAAEQEAKDEADAKLLSYRERVENIYGKAANGVKQGSVVQYEHLKKQVLEAFSHFQALTVLMEYAKARKEWAQETLNFAEHETAQTWDNMKELAYQYGKKPDLLLLDSTRQMATVLNILTQRFTNAVEPWIPVPGADALKRVSQYTGDISRSVTEAQSLGDLKTEAIQQVRSQLDNAKNVVDQAVDYVADHVPVEWLKSRSKSQSSLDQENATEVSREATEKSSESSSVPSSSTEVEESTGTGEENGNVL